MGSDQAQIRLANGKRARIESMLPLRTKNGAGDLAPVDLSLDDHGSYFSPGNPLTALRIAKRLGDGVSLGDVGVRVVPAGSGDVEASLVSGKPFWANVDTDVDMLVKPLPNGVESFWQLRSQDSPERLSLKLDLPAGATLREASGANALGAVEVVKDGRVLARVAAPGTRDADGQPVPTSMSVHRDRVIVSVAHRGRDVAYPLTVDPTVTVSDPNWYASDSSDFDGWLWWSAASVPQNCGIWLCSTFFWGFPNYPTQPNRCVGQASCNGGWGRGLYTAGIGNNGVAYAGDWGEWAFFAGNIGPEVSITRAEFADTWSYQGCSGYGCGMLHWQGLYNNQANNWVSIWTTTTGYTGNSKRYCTPAACDAPTTGQNATGVASGMAVYGTGYFPTTIDYIASAYLVMSDDTGPNSLSVTHSNQPSGWVQDASETVTASAADGGVGVKELDVTARKPDGSTQTLASAVNPCPGNRHGWCPANWTAALAYNTQGLPEGDNTLTITAKDAWGNQTDSAEWHVKIDRSPPSYELEGDLRPAGDVWAGAGSETLTVVTPDIDDTSSGAPPTEIDVYLDGQPIGQQSVPDQEACPEGEGCDFSVDASALAGGPHTVRAVIRDEAGNAAEQSWPVKVDHTGPGINLSGSLKASEGQHLTNDTYDLNVDTEDGASGSPQGGVQSIDINVNGAQADHTEQDCATNSCPLTHTWTYHSSAFGSGPQTITVVATDFSGNESSQTFNVNGDRQARACTPQALLDGPDTCAQSEPACTIDPGSRGASDTSNLVLTPAQALQQLSSFHFSSVAASISTIFDGLSVAPSLGAGSAGAPLEASGTLTPLSVAQDPTGGFRLGAGMDAICFKPTTIDGAATSASPGGPDATLFANVAHGVDSIIRSTADGVETLMHVRDRSAPETFSWRVDLPGATSLRQLDNGSVAVVQAPAPTLPDDDVTWDNTPLPQEGPPPSGNLESALPDAAAQLAEGNRQFVAAQRRTDDSTLTVIGAPWAKDAVGTPVPTSLAVSGPDTITMTVSHRSGSYVYPILADPGTHMRRQMRFMTYNIRGHNRPGAEHFPRINLRGIAYSIAHADHGKPADVAGLQEVCRDEAVSIRNYLRNTYRLRGADVRFSKSKSFAKGHVCHGGAVQYGNAIVRTRYSWVGSGSSCEIPCASAAADPSRLAWQTLRLPGIGTLRFYTTHMGRKYHGTGSSREDEIANAARRYHSDRLKRKMITGDFNSSPTNTDAKGRRFLSVFDTSDTEAICEVTCPSDAWTTLVTKNNIRVKFDYIYFGFAPGSDSAAWVIDPKDRNGHSLSDHRAIITRTWVP